MIKDDIELDRIIQTTIFHEFKLVNLPLKQADMSSQESFNVALAAANDTIGALGLAPCKESKEEQCTGVDPCQGSSLSFHNVASMLQTTSRCVL